MPAVSKSLTRTGAFGMILHTFGSDVKYQQADTIGAMALIGIWAFISGFLPAASLRRIGEPASRLRESSLHIILLLQDFEKPKCISTGRRALPREVPFVE